MSYWPYVLASVARIVTYIAIIVYASTQRYRHGRSASLVIIGALLLLASQTATRVLEVYLVRVYSPADIASLLGFVSLFNSGLNLMGILLLVSAAFRRSPEVRETGADGSIELPDRPRSDNPYDPPQGHH